jgi:trehalose/maltose transport system permease protein
MFPLILPGLAGAGILAFLTAWNEYLLAISFTQTPDEWTIPVQIFEFVPVFSADSAQIPWGDMMAANVLVALPLVALALAFQRLILTGLRINPRRE